MSDRMPKSKIIAPKVPESRAGDLHIRDATSSDLPLREAAAADCSGRESGLYCPRTAETLPAPVHDHTRLGQIAAAP